MGEAQRGGSGPNLKKSFDCDIFRQMPNPGLKTAQAKALRRRMTPAEWRLWSRIRANRFHGLKFQRQEPVGPYIVDFYCSTARLVIELDGDAHYFTSRNDAIRQRFLEKEGMRVIRFPNFEVMNNLSTVLAMIYSACEGHILTGPNVIEEGNRKGL